MTTICSGRALRVSVAILVISIVIGIAPLPIYAQRISTVWSNGWRFKKGDVSLDANTATWQVVSVPHTWNLKDGEHSRPRKTSILAKGRAATSEKHNSYYRGPGWYAYAFNAPEKWRGHRVFLQFEAASIVADVYLNGIHLGSHRGAFTAFTVELTPELIYGKRNEIRVRVDNSYHKNIPPLGGDFNMFGGLYRPVHLLITNRDCISPLNMGSSGVFITLASVSPNKAVIHIRSILSLFSSHLNYFKVRTALVNADGHVVATTIGKISLRHPDLVEQTLTVSHPHLWNGIPDPYLYSMHVALLRKSKVIDEVVQPLGIRTVAITEAQGFLLNGKPYPIWGVGRKQERLSDGWALTPEDELEDVKTILAMGATAVRDAHYPMSQHWHDLCDKYGLLVWDEVPLVNRINDTPEFAANASQQLQEMILQLNNHPSVAFWGLFNELRRGNPDTDKLLIDLKAQIKGLDETRLIVGASNQPNASFNKIPDFIAFNYYPGWYGGKVSDLSAYINARYHEVGHRIALSEYGAGGDPTQHQEGPPVKPAPTGYFHPEEYQDYVHEQLYSQIKGNPHLWGSFLWVMFDFASNGRDEGAVPGINDKGLVTHNHQLRKDAYFFYQANWSKKPMVYIASRRMIERHQPKTTIHVYSNMSSVTLYVNGRSLGATQPNNVNVFRWADVKLAPGINRIRAVGLFHGNTIEDKCDWRLLAPEKENAH